MNGWLVIAALAAAVVLQIVLTKMNKRMGLVLPAATLVMAVLAIPGWVDYMPPALTESSFLLLLELTELPKVAYALNGMYIFILYNVPTLLLLMTSYAYGFRFRDRSGRKLEEELKRMDAEDLG
jgi:hypothetical protein